MPFDDEDEEWEFENWTWFDGINCIDICIHFHQDPGEDGICL